MTATASYGFSGYVLRPARQQDLQLAELWTTMDKFHAGHIKPDFWLFQGPKTDSYLLFDGAGPVFFLKVHQQDPVRVRLHIQFMPVATEEDRERTMEGLLQGTAWLERLLRGHGVEEISFDSVSRPLINFASKRLGFEIVSYTKETGEFRLMKFLLEAMT